MKGEALDCAQIRRVFVDGRVPAGPDVDAHLQGCPSCAQLFEKNAALGRQLAQGVLPSGAADDLFQGLAQRLERERGPRAWLRELPSSVRMGVLLVLALGLLVGQLGWSRRVDFSEYSPSVFWGVVGLLFAALCWGSWQLVRGASAPLRSPGSQRASTWALLLLPALAALLVPLGAPASASVAPEAQLPLWGSVACFNYGAALVLPFVALAWLFERRERMPWQALVSAGALAGITANLLLHAHCASEHLGHLLLGHASIGLAWALGLGLLGAGLQRR
jgi:hypothetical protein